MDAIPNADASARIRLMAGLHWSASTVEAFWGRLRHEFAEAAAAILPDTSSGQLAEAGSCHAILMFGTLSPDLDENDALTLAREMLALSDPRGDPDSVRDLVHHEPFSAWSTAWRQGYDLAESFLEALETNAETALQEDIEQFLEQLGIAVRDMPLTDQAIRGVAVAGERHRPGILVNTTCEANRFPSGRRFTVAHELCHLLHDRSLGNRLALASGPWAPRDVERRANAFAAMTLMPPRLIESALAQLGGNVNTLGELKHIARFLRGSLKSVLRHLFDLGYVDRSTRDRLETELDFKSESTD